MQNQEFLEQMQRRIAEVMAHSPARDLEASLKAILTSWFSRLDLVTREEFDVQRQVLMRTREKLEQLEARLSQMELPAPMEGAAQSEAPPRQGA